MLLRQVSVALCLTMPLLFGCQRGNDPVENESIPEGGAAGVDSKIARSSWPHNGSAVLSGKSGFGTGGIGDEFWYRF